MKNLSAVDEAKDIATKEYVDGSRALRTYSGSTNQQYDCDAGIVRSLTVQGQSVLDSDSIRSIESVAVRGRNLLNGNTASTGTIRGVTYIKNADGTYAISGTQTGGWAFHTLSPADQVFPTGTYTLSSKSFPNNCYIRAYDNANAVLYANLNENRKSQTFTLTEPTKLRVYFGSSNTTSGIQVSGVLYPMLEQADAAHDYEPYSLTTITAPLRSINDVHDELQVRNGSVVKQTRIGSRAYQSGDESDTSVLTDGTTTYYALTTPTETALPDILLLEIGSAFSVLTELDSTFELTAFASHMHKIADVEGLQDALVPSGGAAGQVLAKASATNYDVEWVNQSGATSPDVLYNDASGTSGNVTLSSSAANYTHMRIYFMSGGSGSPRASVDVYDPHQKYAALTLLSTFYNPQLGSVPYLLGKRAYINGTSITVDAPKTIAIASSVSVTTTDSINIYRVEAWN